MCKNKQGISPYTSAPYFTCLGYPPTCQLNITFQGYPSVGQLVSYLYVPWISFYRLDILLQVTSSNKFTPYYQALGISLYVSPIPYHISLCPILCAFDILTHHLRQGYNARCKLHSFDSLQHNICTLSHSYKDVQSVTNESTALLRENADRKTNYKVPFHNIFTERQNKEPTNCTLSI